MGSLAKMIDHESEITTGTKATQANFEKFQGPRYQAKLDRIKPQAGVAEAELNIHNNKYKDVKDSATIISQAVGVGKTVGLFGIRKRAVVLAAEEKYRVQRRSLLRARFVMEKHKVLRRALAAPEEELWS